MDNNNWPNKSMRQNYYDTGLGMDMTERGESRAGEPERAQTGGYHAVYRTRDIWQAAALDCYGVPCLGARRLPTGRNEWEFDNAGDRAWKTGQEFRTGW